MISSLRLLTWRLPGGTGLETPVLALFSEDPEADLVALAPFRLAAFPTPEGTWTVRRLGVPDPLGLGSEPWEVLLERTRSHGAPLPLGLFADPARPRPVHLFPRWPGQEADLEVRRFLEEEAGAPPERLRELLESNPDPRLAVLLAERLAEAGERVAASAADLEALELDANFLPALLRLVHLDPDPVLARLALARILALVPGHPLAEAAGAALEERWGPEVRGVAARSASRVDLRRPFRDQWGGALWTDLGGRDPLEPRGVYQICLEHALRDGHLEDWERELAERLGEVLHLSPEVREDARARAEEVLALRREGVDLPEPLDREELFRSLAGAVHADGFFEPEELECLERVRSVLGLPGELARDLLRDSGERQRETWELLRGLLRGEGGAAERLRSQLFAAPAALRPGLADTYGALLDELRIEAPERLPELLVPLPEVERSSSRLVLALEAALEAAAAATEAGREAAMELVRVNPRQAGFLAAVGRGLKLAQERGGASSSGVLPLLEELRELSPRSREIGQASHTIRLELASDTRPILGASRAFSSRSSSRGSGSRSGSGSGSGSAPNPFARSPREQAFQHLDRIEDGIDLGTREAILAPLEQLVRLTRRHRSLLPLERWARGEICLAAAYRGWQDVVDLCLERDLQEGAVLQGQWPVWVRLMAAGDLACRQGRRAEVESLLMRLGMTPGREALTPLRRAMVERFEEGLREAASLPSGPPP